jgi:uncharacterized membrane protein YgcG
VSDGEVFSPIQRDEIARAVREAEKLSGRAFAVHVGPSEGDARHTAERLHAALSNPTESIMIHVDPQLRDLEIVTGASVRTQLTNRQAALAALGMQTAFAAGDLTRGLLSGIQQLAEQARAPVSLHVETP